ncbi:MAG: FxsA family protein [Halioglobus sp.]
MRIVFILLPWFELFTLIELGIKTSALTALAYVLFTGIVGLAILQRQGRGMFERLRQAQDGRVIGPELLLDDMVMGLVGLLLIVPGMITDVVAVVVAIGPLRRRLARALMGPKPEIYRAELDQSGHQTIEGDFRKIDDP